MVCFRMQGVIMLICLLTSILQCTSVLLEAYVPVLIIGFCMQLVLPLLLFLMLNDEVFGYFPQFIRSHMPGIFWPEFWYKMEDRRTVHAEEFLKIPNVICRDMLHPIAVMMTFGLCSPPLGCLAAAVGIVKCLIWIWALGRFSTFYIEKDVIEMNMARVNRYISLLCELKLPLRQVFRKAYWVIILYSMIFMVFLYWDTSGEIGWEVPVTVASLVLLLYIISYITTSKLNMRNEQMVSVAEMATITVSPLIMDNQTKNMPL